MKKIGTLILILFLITINFNFIGCNAKITSVDIYDEFTTYASRETKLFTTTKNSENITESVRLNINLKDENTDFLGLDDDIMFAIKNETLSHKSDFSVLIDTYLPVTEFSLKFFLEHLNFLNEYKNQISKSEAKKIYDKFKELKKSTANLNKSITLFNNEKTFFTSSDYLNYVKGSTNYYNRAVSIYQQFNSLKKSLNEFISNCFELNNTYIQIANKNLFQINLLNYSYNEILNNKNYDSLYIYRYITQCLSNLAEIAFKIDGQNCQFLDTNETYSRLTYIDEEISKKESSYKMDLHIYNEHVLKLIEAITLFKNVNGSSSITNWQTEEIFNSMYVLQTHYYSLMQTKSTFETSLENIDYKEYIEAKNSNNNEKLNEIKNNTNFKILNNFIDNNYNNVIYIFTSLLNKITN